MSYYEHLGGLKYRLCVRDPSSLKRKRLYHQLEIPEAISKAPTKIEKFLILELAKFEERVESGEVMKPEKMTLRQFIPKWEMGYANENLSGLTRVNTMAIINARILPEFGDSRLEQIKTLHIVTFMAGLKKKDGEPLATNSKLNVYKALKSLFDSAHSWRLIATNPMDGVDRPSAAKKEKRAMKGRKKSYTRSEAADVITALYSMPENWRIYFLGVILGGFRRGEMLAMQWDRVDHDSGGLHVLTQITLDENKHKVEAEVKTEESEGFVPMPAWYMAELKEFRKAWVKEKLNCPVWNGGRKEFLFHSGDGDFYYPSTATGTWRKFLKSSNLPYIRLHDLRHTTAMILRESGADLKTIQERLRHTKLATTADIYMEESQQVSRDAADRLEDLNPRILKFAPDSAPKHAR